MTTFKRTTGFLAVAACLLAAGCGSDDEGAGIPRNSAAALENQLDSIRDRFDFPGGAACADITDGDDPNTTAVQRAIDGLPADVDSDVRDALQQGFDRLFQLVEEQCKKPQTETQTDTVTEPAPPPPETETETETTPPPTTETTPPPTETTEPPATDTEQQASPGQGGDAPGAEGGSGEGGQGGDAGGGQGGSGGGALVPGDEG